MMIQATSQPTDTEPASTPSHPENRTSNEITIKASSTTNVSGGRWLVGILIQSADSGDHWKEKGIPFIKGKVCGIWSN